MAEVLYTGSALLDLDRIHEYYSRYNSERGDQFTEKLSETIYLLATMPLIGRSRDELLSGLRMFVHERHVIFYTQTENGILIERVASPYQNNEDSFSETPLQLHSRTAEFNSKKRIATFSTSP